MFTALKKLTKLGEDRSPAPVPMSSSLQKKFSRGVHFNMKILIKGDRNVGKSCLLQRLQGGPFVEEYVATEQIQVAPIHWAYKNTDHIVKVEVWEVVDKGRAKKKPPLGLKLENQLSPSSEDGNDTPVLDATFLDVYKSATGVILMFDITKPWTFDYVVKELTRAPADLAVIILGNHCDMQHHRQVHSHHIQQAIYQAKCERTAPIRYAESSMRNGFGLRLLHKFLSVPFLRLQKTSLLEQLQRNQRDMEETELELDHYQNSEDSQYEVFLDRLANKRRQNVQDPPCPITDRSPSIVLGAGKPIVPPDVNPLLAQSLNPMGIKAQHSSASQTVEREKQTHFVNLDLLNPNQASSQNKQNKTSTETAQINSERTPASPATFVPQTAKGPLDDFYAGTLDSSFLEDLPTSFTNNQETNYDSDSDNDTANPMVAVIQDDIDLDYDISYQPSKQPTSLDSSEENLPQLLTHKAVINTNKNSVKVNKEVGPITLESKDKNINMDDDEIKDVYYGDFPIWAGDSSARRSPEGDENPDSLLEPAVVAVVVPEKVKKPKKKKSKEKDDGTDKSEKKHKKHKKSKAEKSSSSSAQQDLVGVTADYSFYDVDEYDSI